MKMTIVKRKTKQKAGSMMVAGAKCGGGACSGGGSCGRGNTSKPSSQRLRDQR